MRIAAQNQSEALTGHSGILPRVPVDTLSRNAVRAHESLGSGSGWLERLRPSVRESWQRSLQHQSDPDRSRAEMAFDDDAALARYRAGHPLSVVMPVIQRLLVEPAEDSGLLVAVGDELGRLLWVHGDRALCRRAEGMLFMAGADWSERTVGTSAPGTALATASDVQIAGPEHFSRLVHSLSCTAVPVRDPDSGAVLGVVDVTGGPVAVAPHTLALVRAAVAAAEAHLQVHRLRSSRDATPRTPATAPGSTSGRRARRPAPPATPAPGDIRESLQLLGRDRALLHTGGQSVELSSRHGELLAVLALYPAGRSAEELAVLAYPDGGQPGTVRAEMLRLRNLMESVAAQTSTEPLVPRSRPYRLARPLVVDAAQVLGFLEQGAYRLALRMYGGPVLPRSEAPAVLRLRAEVSAVLRQAMISAAGADTLLQYLRLGEAEHDAEAWQRALQVLPSRSPRRAAVVAALERIERDLA